MVWLQTCRYEMMKSMSLLSNGQNHICKNKKYCFNSDYDVWLKFIVLKAIFNKIISMNVCKKINYEKYTKVNTMISTTTNSLWILSSKQKSIAIHHYYNFHMQLIAVLIFLLEFLAFPSWSQNLLVGKVNYFGSYRSVSKLVTRKWVEVT